MSLKQRLIALFALFLLLFVGIGGTVIIADARERVGAEMESVLDLAGVLIGHSGIAVAPTLRNRPAAEHIAALSALLVPARKLRHVQIRLLDRSGAVIGETGASEARDDVPGWFATLVGAQPQVRRIDLPPSDGDGSDDDGPAAYAVVAEPWDEVAEVWETACSLGSFSLLLSAGLLLLLAVAVGRALAPLRQFQRELARMEHGDFGVRLDQVGVPELAPIAAGIRALGDSLARSQSDNRRLAVQLVEVEDRERRDLARDIHDELGPSLFALKIDARELHKLARNPAAARPEQIDERGEAVMDAIESIHQLSRRVLGRLRPAVLDHLPLSDVLRDEVDRWRRQKPDIQWRLDLEGPIDSLSDPVRLTVYRVIQEAIMNAVRHAGPTDIAVSVERRATAEAERVVVSVCDDGQGRGQGGDQGGAGPSATGGFGIPGMTERVHALAGSLTVRPSEHGGTMVRAIIPTGPTGAPTAPPPETVCREGQEP
ncbi:histidine kinase [Azospirillum canadense]|uniref:histidine kinase n=1 Tax=Azospirillum canadense TaxID=403962 RepID=UPI002227D150|nr:histidine kinase [Azospirillum canadense]MCW2236378.1 two-component system sensor histidine kinase UhpB [Azospirillum canadense]